MSPYWEEFYRLGERIDAAKRNYKTSRQAVKSGGSPYGYGMIGEKAYSLFTGLPMDTEERIGGDDGNDFSDGTDVKSHPYFSPNACHLLHPIDAKHWPDWRFVLVTLDVNSRVATFRGWASVKELRGAPVRTFHPKMGPQHYVDWRELHHMRGLLCKRCQPQNDPRQKAAAR